MKRIQAVFFINKRGKEPVRDWLLSLEKPDRHVLGEDIKTAEYGWPVGMPVVRPLGNGLWEVRSALSNARIARVIFTVLANKMVLLHGFIKKAQKTPKPDLDLARKRKRELGE